jgi:hypothetical protein
MRLLARAIALVFVQATLTLLPSGTAQATHGGWVNGDACAGTPPCWWTYRGTWYHYHTRNMYLWNGVHKSNYALQATKYAQGWWHWNTILNLSSVNDSRYARILVWDDFYGNVPWAGLAYPPGHDRYQNWVYLNDSYLNNDWNKALAVACQEIGHELGLGHANGDCMGYGYHPDRWAQNVYSPSQASYNAINWGYQTTGH